jgi:hypothetical protein
VEGGLCATELERRRQLGRAPNAALDVGAAVNSHRERGEPLRLGLPRSRHVILIDQAAIDAEHEDSSTDSEKVGVL